MLAVTSLTRVPDLPDVQTVAESFPGFEVISWQGLCTPAGVPKAALARLRTELAAVLALPETRKRLAEQSRASSPARSRPISSRSSSAPSATSLRRW